MPLNCVINPGNGVGGRLGAVTVGIGDGDLCLWGRLSGVASSALDGTGDFGAFGCGGVGGGRETNFLIGLSGRISLGVEGALTSEGCLLPSEALMESIVFSLDLSEPIVPLFSNSSGSSSISW